MDIKVRMGQGSSVTENRSNVDQRLKNFSSNSDALRYFNEKALRFLTTPELVAFRSKIGGKKLTENISNEEITKWLHMPSDNIVLREVFYNFIRVLSNFPLIREGFDNVTGFGLLKSIVLIDHERCRKYLGLKSYNQTRLMFIGLATSKSIKEDYESTDSSPSRTSLNEVNSFRHYDRISVDELMIPATYLQEFITWLLLLTTHCPTNNCEFPADHVYREWPTYKNSAMNILRSMDPSLVSTGEPHSINYEQFSNTITTVIPDIFAPLERIMEHFLYQESDLVFAEFQNNLSTSKLMNQALIAQLALSLPKELAFSKLQKLYVGRESGFSMRSLQAKVFKWMAPTVILVSGKCILNDEEYSIKNTRYKKFLQEFPKLKDDSQHLNEAQLHKNKVIFAVYISENWKVTNKGYFGGPGTRIIQISPTCDLFKATQPDVVYFNTVGGGIGIGSKQPTIKGLNKSYSPGNVSLTLDSTLEFAVFRHVGNGGTISPGMLISKNNSEDKPFEIRMLLQDVEVWGCGGEKELQEQMKQWQWEETEAKRRQQINLRSMGEDRALLVMAGILGEHSQSGGSM